MKGSVILCLLLGGTALLPALSGFGTTGPVTLDTIDPEVQILSPTGGEQWYMGGSFDILWQATDTYMHPSPVNIWYSLNGGSSFIPLVEASVNDGSEAWTSPLVETDAARIKIEVQDNFGNASNSISGLFSLTAVIPQPPQDVVVDTSNNVDAVLSWQAVTHDVLGQPVTPAGYIILYSEIPFSTGNSYYFLGETSGLSYTHARVLLFRRQMYYRIVAYLDSDNRIGKLLATHAGEPKARLDWPALKKILQQGGSAQ